MSGEARDGELPVLRGRRRPRWQAALVSAVRRSSSLRWRAGQRLAALRTTGSREETAAIIGSRLSRFLSHPAGLPVLLPLVVLGLALADPRHPELFDWPLLHDGQAMKDVLGLVWQVEAAVVALVAAVCLFVFESLIRQRAEIPLEEYARRARLMPFLMFGAAGLLSVGFALIITPSAPRPAASVSALLISSLGLVELPFLLHRMMRLVHPDWMRVARLEDAARAVRTLVAADALERAALIELSEWAAAHAVRVQFVRIGFGDGQVVVESAPADSVVWDINLRALEKMVRRRSDALLVLTRIGERVVRDEPLISAVSGSYAMPRPVCTVVERRPSLIDSGLRDLREEALESIRRESVTAIEGVTDAYRGLLRAWPEAWHEFGQTLSGGLLQSVAPFGLGPVDELKSHLWVILELAVDRGLRDHAMAITSLLWSVGADAIRFSAHDLLSLVTSLAQQFATMQSHTHPELAGVIVERSWRAQIELCDTYVAMRLQDEALDGRQRLAAAESAHILSTGVTETLKNLLDVQRHGEFRDCDGRFQKLLRHWESMPDRRTASRLLGNASEIDATQADAARVALQLHDARQHFEVTRRGQRLCLLAWALRRYTGSADENLAESIRSLLVSLGTVSQAVEGVGPIIDAMDRELMSRWLSWELPELEAGIIDTDGVTLRALALILMNQPALEQLDPAGWMNENRIGRLKALVDDVSGLSTLLSGNPTAAQAAARAQSVNAKLDEAWVEQQAREAQQLIVQPLDESKQTTFVAALIAGWAGNRVIDRLAGLTGLVISPIPESDFGSSQFGFPPRLLPKGLFVTPTSWVSGNDYAAEVGRGLAISEVTAVVQTITDSAQESPLGGGDVAERLGGAIRSLREAGHSPSLIILPIDWRLWSSLGLTPRDVQQSSANDPILGRNYLGRYEGIPAIDWWHVPKGRAYVADLAACLRVSEGIIGGSPLPPIVALEVVDDTMADTVLADWPQDSPKTPPSRTELLSSMRLQVRRPYKVIRGNPQAALWVALPAATED